MKFDAASTPVYKNAAMLTRNSEQWAVSRRQLGELEIGFFISHLPFFIFIGSPFNRSA
jgi:hypothetical protein